MSDYITTAKYEIPSHHDTARMQYHNYMIADTAVLTSILTQVMVSILQTSSNTAYPINHIAIDPEGCHIDIYFSADIDKFYLTQIEKTLDAQFPRYSITLFKTTQYESAHALSIGYFYK